MTKKAHIIELNGKRYDAVTGKLLVENMQSVRAASSTRTIDGVIAVPRIHAATTHRYHAETQKDAEAKIAKQPTSHNKPKVFDVQRSIAPHTPGHRPERAKTLMRHVVHQPAASLKRRIKAIPRTDAVAKTPALSIIPKYAFHTVSDERLKRARHIAKNQLVTRFGTTQSHATKQVSSIVEATPQTLTELTSPLTTKQSSTDIFERALAHATTHQQEPLTHRQVAKKSARIRHAMSITASSLAILLIVGFIAYQNAAAIQMRVASSRAGISASLPAWRPAGFEIGRLTYGTGMVGVTFQNSNNGTSSFNLIQTASTWDSNTLLNSFVMTHYSAYNEVQTGSRLIYIDSNNNATWVDNGIWYQLTTNGALSTSQIVHLATST